MGIPEWVLVRIVEDIPRKADAHEALLTGNIHSNSKWAIVKGPTSELRASPELLPTHPRHTHLDSHSPLRIQVRLIKRAEVLL